jgi:hypothetical protein
VRQQGRAPCRTWSSAPLRHGIQDSPLFADDEHIGQQLLSEPGRHAIIENNNNSENSVFFIDISEPNQQALTLQEEME